MGKRINELARIIEFFDRVQLAYEKYSGSTSFGFSTIPSGFFSVIFESKEKMNKEHFCRSQLMYVDLLNVVIQKVRETWDSAEKVCDVIACIKNDILKLNYDDTGNQIYGFCEKCKTYKLQIELFEVSYAQKYDEDTVEEAELNKLLQKVEKLLEEIRCAHVDSEFREVMLEQLYLIKVSFEKYRLFGKKTILKEVKALTGIVVVDAGRYQEGTEERRVLQSVGNVIRHILGVITDEGILIAVKKMLGIEG